MISDKQRYAAEGKTSVDEELQPSAAHWPCGKITTQRAPIDKFTAKLQNQLPPAIQ
jgi:ferric-dicitrate binding protein FerR (iron transport regulator)